MVSVATLCSWQQFGKFFVRKLCYPVRGLQVMTALAGGGVGSENGCQTPSVRHGQNVIYGEVTE
jgi:hypothetical protein